VLGNAGRDVTFREPTGKYFDEDKRNRYVSEEIVCNAVESLGENYFIYGWVIRLVLDAVWPRADNDGSSAKMLVKMRDSNYGDGVGIVEANLPAADWSKYDMNKVQLYNLRADPFEANNVALDNVQLVEAMTSRLRKSVENDPPHNLSVQKKFVELASGVVKHTLVALVLIFIIMVVAVFKGAFASIKFCLFLGGFYMASLIFAVKLTQVCLASMAVFLCRTAMLQNGKKEKTV
jgi:uncharacterized membrane protein